MRGQLVIAGAASCLLFVSGLALDCIVGNGVSYRGTFSVTETGKTCQRWDSQTPHDHSRTPENYPSSGLEQTSACRNPDGEPRVWCYTTDPGTRWDWCDAPSCAQQSSSSSDGAATRAVDGNYGSTGSCTQTLQEADPSWWVDLGQSYMVGRVIIINRGDCCQERINPFNIHIGDSELIHTNPKCGGDHQIDVSQPSISVPCEGMKGRYVGVRLPGPSRTLTLCEVHISGIVKCSPGYFRCADKYTCILSWRRCDGTSDCPDRSDEERCVCSRIPEDFQLNSRLTMLPNPMKQTTAEEIRNSSAVELLNSSYSIAGEHHPELREFVSTVIFPGCNVTKENLHHCPSSNITASCVGRQLLPCRSWCEEVFSMSEALMRDLLPPCELFPSPQHACWNPEPAVKDTEVCYHGTGTNYRGTWSTTTSGAKCLEWSDDNYKAEYPWANLDKNYCRNPTGLERPFCLTEDGSKEECDVIPCNRGPPIYGKRTPSKRFYLLEEKVTYTCNDGYMLEYGYPREVRCRQGNSSSAGVWEYHMPTCSVNYKRRLQKELLGTYSASLAPDENVTINFWGEVEQIVNLDEKKEQLLASLIIDFTWYDARLKWNPKYYGDIETFSVPGKDIWIPAFTLKRK
uniref:Kringle domain-containing protein n=1 Tax=Branchiostoma floridae TaxID=7739 RepID=C3Z4U6_BRAFL|eukprot:XP_002596291.1 hypothetical protein BRAFLDRAFT_82105 [Branchiostoma floridae]